jgi:CHAT domain-containing protein
MSSGLFRFVLVASGAVAMAQTDPAIEEGNRLIKNGEVRQAQQLARRLLAEREASTGPQSKETGEALVLLVDSIRFDGRALTEEQRTLAARAIAVAEKNYGADSLKTAQALLAAGALYTAGRDLMIGRDLSRRAVAIYDSVAGSTGRSDKEFLTDWATAIALLGSAERDLEDFQSAKAHYLRAVAIYEKSGTDDPAQTVAFLNNLATIENNLRETSDAQAHYRKAIEIANQAHLKEEVFLAANFGRLLALMNNYLEAVGYLERARVLGEKEYGDNNVRMAVILVNLGKALSGAGRYAEAEPILERSRDIFARTVGPQDLLAAGSWMVTAHNFAASGKTKDALDAAVRAEAGVRAYDEAAIRGQAEREALLHVRLRARGDRASGLPVLLSLAAAHADPSPALDQLIRSRAEVFDEMIARHRAAEGSGDASVRALAADLDKARGALAALILGGKGNRSSADYAAQLEQARNEKEKAERNLAIKSARFRLELDAHRAGLAEVAAALPPGSVVVSYARYAHSPYAIGAPQANPGAPAVTSYMAFVLHSGAASPSAIRLGTAAEIEDLIRAVREKVADEAGDPGRAPHRSEQLYRDAAARLRQKIWDPVAPLVGAAERVFLVPDGDLNLVNFAALPTGASAYLIEKGPLLHYLSSERDLLTPASPPSSQRGLLALGNPAFDTRPEALSAQLRGTNCSALQNLRFDRLPNSAREVQDLAALWREAGAGDAVVLTGSAASKEAFLGQAGHQRVLHLATHGFFLGSGCQKPTESNPLLESGLVLAGANERAAAGIVTAEEIVGLRLDGVDWAVLSACDTAMGETLAGEGVFGLRRAFQQAGARTVIMSLWPADDQVTRDWMRNLYRARLAAHLDTARSVQRASLGLLEGRRKSGRSTHPLYWGGFIAAGAWK